MAETTKAATKQALPKEVFAVDVPNHELLKLAYTTYLSNARIAGASTKTRGLVSGGGKKPWRQKGTGRARFGSSRNPIWRGGGIVFGPTGNENFKKKLSTTSKRVALRQALTLAAKSDKIVIKPIKTTGKTKDVASFLTTNKYTGRVLIVVDEKTPELIRSTNNIQNVELVRSTYLSVYHILNADTIILSPDSVETIKSWLIKEEA